MGRLGEDTNPPYIGIYHGAHPSPSYEEGDSTERFTVLGQTATWKRFETSDQLYFETLLSQLFLQTHIWACTESDADWAELKAILGAMEQA